MRTSGPESYRERLERVVFSSMSNTSGWFYVFVLFLLAVIAWALYAYFVQLRYGLIATGTRDVVIWGLYISNFVFFIGISYAGTLVSAVLRLTNAGWRTPVTRLAEVIAVVALLIGAILPIIDLGRPDRVYNMFLFGRFQSPLLWDITAIMTYMAGGVIYLYLPLIPDLALMRDRLGREASGLKGRVLSVLSVGWLNLPEQRHRLERAMSIMAVLILPLAVSVHTVVAFIFSMTLRPGWDSTIYGIYFVVGAIFSGTAVLLVTMAVLRRVYHLEEYFTEKHFRYLSYLLLTLLLSYLYLTFTEYLTPAYKLAGEEKHLLELVLLGSNAIWFWLFIFGGLAAPALLIIFARVRPIPMIVTASALVAVGMGIKRFIIVVPTLEVPLMPFEFGTYSPTWVELSVTAGLAAAFVLLMALSVKVFPIISIWEVAEEEEKEALSRSAEG